MAEFKDIFSNLRRGRGYTQNKIAELLGVGVSTIGMWESGKRTPKRSMYETIADLFNVDIDYLYGNTEIKRKVLYDEYGGKFIPASDLSYDEEKLLESYRDLSDAGKLKLQDRADELLQLEGKSSPLSSDTPVSCA